MENLSFNLKDYTQVLRKGFLELSFFLLLVSTSIVGGVYHANTYLALQIEAEAQLEMLVDVDSYETDCCIAQS